MIPLTFLAVGLDFRADVADCGELRGLPVGATGRASSRSWAERLDRHLSAYAFLLTWNVIAMEAAACYIGECNDPKRDAKIAMNSPARTGSFIYI